jgi:voltage-gated potassium channel
MIRSVVDCYQSGHGRAFALTIQFLIILSIISFSISTLPDLSDKTRHYLNCVEVFTVIVFTVEYILRVFAAEKRLEFIFSFYGLVDLIAIVPFYLTTSLDLRSIRVFRLLRLVRIFKLLRYSTAMRRFARAFMSIRDELLVFTVVSMLLVYISSVGIYYFENEAQPDKFASVFHSIWWSVATLTTVGYGDVYPITVGGKIFTFFMLMIALGVVAVPTGLLASALTRVPNEEAEKHEDEV